jgi:antitoxin (DNA-binding transcriptional repressor) of toxin-antitoxin stability system
MYEISVDKGEGVDLASLIESVQTGEEITFVKNHLPIAKLVGIPHEKPQPKFGSARGLVVLAEDFDAPLADFDEFRK